jgi:hypothetical protein
MQDVMGLVELSPFAFLTAALCKPLGGRGHAIRFADLRVRPTLGRARVSSRLLADSLLPPIMAELRTPEDCPGPHARRGIPDLARRLGR